MIHLAQRTRKAARVRQSGFMVGYFLLVISLLSVSVWAFSNMFDANAELKWIKANTDLIYDQSLLIRKEVIACGTLFPEGVNNDPNSLPNYKKYPGSALTLSSAECPGAPVSLKYVLAGRDGNFLRQLPSDFSAWSYQNGSAGLTTILQASTPRAAEVLGRVANRFGVAEASRNGNVYTFVIAAPY